MIKAVYSNHEKFRGCIGSGRWTLCVGAGISRDFAPTWFELTHQVVNESFDLTLTEDEFNIHLERSGWNLDAWIQASANHYRRKHDGKKEFDLLIESVLYSEILNRSKSYGLADGLKQILVHPKSASKKRVIEVCNFFEKEFGSCTMLQLVKVLIDAGKQGKRPTSIITLNADTLLETLIDLFSRREHYLGPPPHSHPEYYYKSVKRAKEMSSDKTFIYHCHGAIIPDLASATSKVNDSRDRLIFLEEQYLQLATQSSSWPETLFMFHALTTDMVFLGLSMSDSNIRRWMASSETELKKDMEELKKGTVNNPRHLWINTESKDTNYKKIMLDSLTHLGIRPAYIDDWKEIGNGLTNMLALK